MARPKRPAGICGQGDACPICGCTLLAVKRKRGKGRECLYCKAALFAPSELPRGRSAGGYVHTGDVAFASRGAS